MSKINVLSFEIANLIAAGEVVERPSSVLKELIENSIDSGATSIVAEIKRGGVALIRVTDNGCGMDKDDLPVAIKRHATSKIKNREDLDEIMTLGFRGEALAAISSVSVMTLISKTKDAECGTMMTAEAGEIVDISSVGASEGTTVVVENLFYNVPARRKFLKKDSTEAMNVTALVEKIALSRSDISIQLLVDGEEKFKTPGDGDLLNTVYAVLGKDFSKKLIPVEGSAGGIRVFGFVGRSDNVRKNRNLENIFINGRYVKSLTAMAALEKAFTSYIAPECFPACVLFIEMNPMTVDVNVHPAKLEVKFSDERAVFEAVYYSVRNSLESFEYRPELDLSNKKNDKNPLGAFLPIGEKQNLQQIRIEPEKKPLHSSVSSYSPSPFTNIEKTRGEFNNFKNENKTSGRIKDDFIKRSYGDLDTHLKISSSKPNYKGPDASSQMTPKNSLELLERYRDAKASPSSDFKNEEISTAISESPYESKASLPTRNHRIIGEAFSCYVIVECENELLLIDKHAAHERIIFEDLLKTRANDRRIASQALLLPLCVLLSPEELSCAEEYKDEICELGFSYEINTKAADILSIPSSVSVNDAETLFIKMLDEIISGKGNPEITDEIRREKSLYQIACKAAIKGGRVYNDEIIKWLVEKVLSIPDITVCPHGRPIAYKLTKNELDRIFDRLK